VGKDGFCNKDLKMDCDGWVEVETYRPIPFDLVLCKQERRTVPGWWDGQHWEGIRLHSDEPVIYWKKMSEIFDEEEDDATEQR
jgi:hypothetical protein